MLRGEVDERENNEKTREDMLGRYDPGDSGEREGEENAREREERD